MSEKHREREVPQEEVPVVECLDGLARITLVGRKLSLNCLFAGRNNNNFDLCRPPGNLLDNLTKGPGRDIANFSLVLAILRLSSTRELSFELFQGVREIQKIEIFFLFFSMVSNGTDTM